MTQSWETHLITQDAVMEDAVTGRRSHRKTKNDHPTNKQTNQKIPPPNRPKPARLPHRKRHGLRPTRPQR